MTAGEQLGLAGMPTRLFSATPSKLASYDTCPRRYRMTYVDRPTLPRGGPWAHNSVGAAVHAALKRWWDLPASRRTPEAAGNEVEAGWSDEGFRDSEQSAEFRALARRWVEGYVGTLDPADEPLGVERNVAATTERLAISGRADRIDERDGELVIVDYKTGRRPLSEDDARSSQALAFYVLGARRTLHRPCTRVELHHLPTGTVHGWTHTEASLARQVTRAEATADDIIVATDTLQAGANPDDVFPPRPGPMCSWCDVRRHCPDGQQAAPELERWSGLAELERQQG
ncbi:MAG TPA: PD-(D/E)XK nuclease family protein [Mycobacteriales bacterium]|nr:PD-(D/E)XK nuclease family protein [Mycobacteriales bacterium]